MIGSHDLQRFVDAQSGVIDQALDELRNGRKETHWMWFVFPQLKGLGASHMAQFYGITSRAEAEAYLQHEVLGARLRECTDAVNKVEGRSADEIFGYPDNLKFHSSMTLFAEAAGAGSIFHRALDKFFGGRGDAKTAEHL
jgi:uncharacterized protein (DUF1810 family)